LRQLFGFLENAFHKRETRSYRIVGSIVWALIVGSVTFLLIDLFLPQGHRLKPILRNIDSVFLSLFAVELALRLLTYRPPDLRIFRRPPLGRLRVHLLGRLRYLLQPLMLIDLVTVMALVPGLRALRVLRLLRLLRTARLFRYSNPFSGLFRAFESDRYIFGLAFSFLVIQVVLGGLSLYLIERNGNPNVGSPGDAFWWALVTITTVGFGDITPVTGLGRIVAGFLMVGGMFTLATFAGIVGHSLLNSVLSIREEQFRMGNYVNHLVVCGYEEGMDLLLEAILAEHDPEQTKIVVFANQERPPHISPELYWVQGDPTKESELDKVRIARAAGVVVAGARSASPQQADAITLLTLFTIRSYLRGQHSDRRRFRPVYVVAEILDSENVDHARAAGADEVIETRRLGFSLLSHAIEHHGTADTLSQVVLRGDNTLYVGPLPAESQSSTYAEMVEAVHLSSRGGLIVGVTDRKTGHDHVNPPDGMVLNPDMRILYLARKRLLETE
jgi:voltage-gated potassium channel